MPGIWWFVAIAGLSLASVTLLVAFVRVRAALAERNLRRARGEFRVQREWLEARFLTLAGQSGKPRGLAWSDCEFDNEVAMARDRTTGQLKALVAVTISFEAIEGGGMEDVEAVGNLRAATAVFYYDGTWKTDGRAIFNLKPIEAIRHFQHELETVD